MHRVLFAGVQNAEGRLQLIFTPEEGNEISNVAMVVSSAIPC